MTVILSTHLGVYVRQLSHEKLDVDQKATEFLAIAYQLIESIPKGNGNVVDQLKRASVSVVLNIAEAAGHPSPAKAQHHFAIARGLPIRESIPPHPAILGSTHQQTLLK